MCAKLFVFCIRPTEDRELQGCILNQCSLYSIVQRTICGWQEHLQHMVAQGTFFTSLSEYSCAPVEPRFVILVMSVIQRMLKTTLQVQG